MMTCRRLQAKTLPFALRFRCLSVSKSVATLPFLAVLQYIGDFVAAQIDRIVRTLPLPCVCSHCLRD